MLSSPNLKRPHERPRKIPRAEEGNSPYCPPSAKRLGPERRQSPRGRHGQSPSQTFAHRSGCSAHHAGSSKASRDARNAPPPGRSRGHASGARGESTSEAICHSAEGSDTIRTGPSRIGRTKAADARGSCRAETTDARRRRGGEQAACGCCRAAETRTGSPAQASGCSRCGAQTTNASRACSGRSETFRPGADTASCHCQARRSCSCSHSQTANSRCRPETACASGGRFRTQTSRPRNAVSRGTGRTQAADPGCRGAKTASTCRRSSETVGSSPCRHGPEASCSGSSLCNSAAIPRRCTQTISAPDVRDSAAAGTGHSKACHGPAALSL